MIEGELYKKTKEIAYPQNLVYPVTLTYKEVFKILDEAKVDFPKIMSSDEYGDLYELKKWFKKWFGEKVNANK